MFQTTKHHQIDFGSHYFVTEILIKFGITDHLFHCIELIFTQLLHCGYQTNSC